MTPGKPAESSCWLSKHTAPEGAGPCGSVCVNVRARPPHPGLRPWGSLVRDPPPARLSLYHPRLIYSRWSRGLRACALSRLISPCLWRNRERILCCPDSGPPAGSQPLGRGLASCCRSPPAPGSRPAAMFQRRCTSQTGAPSGASGLSSCHVRQMPPPCPRMGPEGSPGHSIYQMDGWRVHCV